MSGLVVHPRFDLVLRMRLAVLAAMSSAVSALLLVGVAPVRAAAIAVAATAGGLEVGCRLTLPYIVPRTSVTVLIVVLVLVVNATRLGFPPAECLAAVLAAAWCAAELARRLTGPAVHPTARAA